MAVIVEVNERNVAEAGFVHAMSWQASHAHFCSAAFVKRHTQEAQTEYLRREIEAGKRIFMRIEEKPVGVVSVWGDLIENHYVLPTEQNRGYGASLLRFAVQLCRGTPKLWILSNNEGARRFYIRHGFRETGKVKPLKGELHELEMELATL